MPKGPSWKEIERARRSLIANMPHDKFLIKILKGVVRTGKDKGNPIRGNLVASGLRELVTYMLHKLAPDDDVRLCVWFVQAKDTKTVTRAQRARFIIHAGLPNDFVEQELKVDHKAVSGPLLEAMNALQKFTHVRAESVIYQSTAVREMLYEAINEIHALLVYAKECREMINEAVANALHRAVLESLILETIQELDELSTHTRVDHHWINTIKVKRLDATEIHYRITGEVEVELQYGSNSDVANDIGMHSGDSYPYRAKVSADAGKPLDINAEAVKISVDTKSFYE
jgi:hypothetical protein